MKITRELLWSLRNDLPMAVALRQLATKAPPHKFDGERLRFVCPHCGEMLAVVNPRNNLAHCFWCRKNTNNIDLLMKSGYAFLDAVALLREWLRLYRAGQLEPVRQEDVHRAAAVVTPGTGSDTVGAILRRDRKS
ncbi:MAG: hypothetical protein EPN91_06305, partial [Salinibacterium sp.]